MTKKKGNKKTSFLSTALAVLLLIVYLFVGGGDDTAKNTVQPTQTVAVQAAQKVTEQPAVKPTAAPAQKANPKYTDAPEIDEDGSYTTKEDVALYIHTYGKLPGNFITKKEAEKLG